MKPQKRILVVSISLWLALAATASPARAQEPFIVKEHYTKQEQMIPMRDGVKLFTSIYIPKDTSQKYPIMYDRTPYSVSPYGAELYKISLGPSPLFAKEGYIFVYQDVRGRMMSEGQLANLDLDPLLEARYRKDQKRMEDALRRTVPIALPQPPPPTAPPPPGG